MSAKITELGSRWRLLGEGLPKDKEEYYKPSTSKITLKLQDIQDAHNRIKDSIITTPLIEAKYTAKNFCHIFFKCENLQTTGSFKARGACNALSILSPAEKSRGCTVSGGRNFLQAMAYYGFAQSVPINVVVPKDCSLADKQRFKENFALIKVHGSDENEACLHAITQSQMIGSNHIHGTDRLDLLAGYGTLGLEILSQLDKLDAIICPVGCGGLVASLILAVKSLKPNCLIYGVECTAAPTMTRALQEKKPVLIQVNPSVADSLGTVVAGNNAYHVVRGYLDRMITVDEVWVSRALVSLYEREKLVVEGAAACPAAVILAGKVPELRAKNVVCILSGGNLSVSRMCGAVERGLAGEGRLARFAASLPDAGPALQRLLARVADAGADVRTLAPDRSWMQRDVFSFSVNMLLETTDMAHAKELERRLMKEYPRSHFTVM